LGGGKGLKTKSHALRDKLRDALPRSDRVAYPLPGLPPGEGVSDDNRIGREHGSITEVYHKTMMKAFPPLGETGKGVEES